MTDPALTKSRTRIQAIAVPGLVFSIGAAGLCAVYGAWLASAFAIALATVFGALEREQSNKKVLVDELTTLVGQIIELVEAELQAMKAELARVGLIAADASGQLRSAFSKLREQIGAQQQLVSEIKSRLALGGPLSGEDGAVREVTTRVDRVVVLAEQTSTFALAAVQCLQFEDLVQQLTHQVTRRLMLLESFVAAVAATHYGELEQDRTRHRRRVDELEDLLQLLMEHRIVFTGLDVSSVAQESMAEGEIVMF